MRIYIGRHCHSMTQDNINNCRRYKHCDVPLSPLGHIQTKGMADSIRQLLRKLKHTGTLLMECSPFLRVQQTASPIKATLEATGMKVITKDDPNLAEIDRGDFWTLSKDQRRQKWPKEYPAHEAATRTREGWYKTALFGGESPQIVDERIQQAIARMKNDPDQSDRLILTHDLAERFLLKNLLHRDLEWAHTENRPNNGSIRMLEGPDRDHLQDRGYVLPGFESPEPKRHGLTQSGKPILISEKKILSAKHGKMRNQKAEKDLGATETVNGLNSSVAVFEFFA